ncbi:MAG: acyltransferase [Chitinophagales bacterium]|nr:acyltransferase [Chitinophagales bacterium]
MTAPNRQTLHGLNALRSFAILYVFIFHYTILSKQQPEWLTNISSMGWTGVDLFFVLSGFLISCHLFDEIKETQSINLKRFFTKRFFRIIPAFLVIVGLYFLFPFFREKEALPPLWKFLTFTQNIGLNIKDNGTFSHAWSLCVEEHFYLLLPIIFLVSLRIGAFKRLSWLLVILFLAGLIIRIYSYNSLYLPHSNADDSWMYWYRYVYYPTYTRLDGLLVGVAIAALYKFRPATWQKLSRWGNLWILIGACILAIAFNAWEDIMEYQASVYGFPLVDIGLGLIVAGAVSENSFLYRLKSKIINHIAAISYGMYLTHKGIIHITHSLLPAEINQSLLFLVSAITCILAATILYWVVEKPFMQVRRKLVKE